MDKMIKSVAVIVALAIALIEATPTKPRYIGCIDSTECPVGTCCTLGNGKFSIPRCSHLGELGASCTSAAEHGFNRTLTYPDGLTVQMTNVYGVCPCEHAFHCSPHTYTCIDPYEQIKFNQLGDYEN